jgi:hypothetical protein
MSQCRIYSPYITAGYLPAAPDVITQHLLELLADGEAVFSVPTGNTTHYVLWRRSALDIGWNNNNDKSTTPVEITMVDVSSLLFGLSTLWLNESFYQKHTNHGWWTNHDRLKNDDDDEHLFKTDDYVTRLHGPTIYPSVIHTVSEKFVSFASGVIGGCGHVDWANSKLRYLASQLAPANMRLGGTQADCARYLLPTTKKQPPPTGLPVCKWGEMNLTMSTWRAMVDFVANSSGLSFTFDLNELDGRTCHTQDEPIFKHNASACVGDWDPSNTIEFLQYIKDNGLKGGLVALELGNELTRMQRGWKGVLTVNQTIRDLRALSAVLDQVWPGASGRPKVMVGLYPIVTFQYSSTTLYHVSYIFGSCFSKVTIGYNPR